MCSHYRGIPHERPAAGGCTRTWHWKITRDSHKNPQRVCCWGALPESANIKCRDDIWCRKDCFEGVAGHSGRVQTAQIWMSCTFFAWVGFHLSRLRLGELVHLPICNYHNPLQVRVGPDMKEVWYIRQETSWPSGLRPMSNYLYQLQNNMLRLAVQSRLNIGHRYFQYCITVDMIRYIRFLWATPVVLSATNTQIMTFWVQHSQCFSI